MTIMRPLTGGARIANALVANNVKALFGIPGTHTVPIYRALQELQPAITTITTRHEAGAGYAADGYARQTGELAAVCVVTGIGLTNTITPMAAALADSVPMLVISSEVPSFWSARPARQYSHFVPRSDSIAAAVSKRSFSVDTVDDIDAAVAEACELARSGRPGPVHLSVPIDVLAATSTTATGITAPMASTVAPLTAEARAALAEAAGALHGAERPVVIAGGGAIGAPLAALAEALDAPVLCTVAGKGALHEGHPLAAGARLHHPLAREALLDEADALLLVGTQLSPTDYWQFAHTAEVPLPPALLRRATHVDLDPASLEQGGVGRAGGRAVLADAALACEALLQTLAAHGGGGGGRRWGGGAAEVIAAAKASADAPAALSETLMWDFEAPEGGGHAMVRTLRALRAAVPDDAPLVSDVCRLGYTALSLYPSHGRSGFLYPVGTTALGYGLPAAVGAALGRRLTGDAGPVVAIVGDGGLQLSAQELAVAAEEKLPLLLVVWNDGSYAAQFGAFWRNSLRNSGAVLAQLF